ncbi:MAG: hypothetical protein NZ700_07165 [Gemmataceae bacterium]|nr:hypothetical protein [Gemmataceae bacterium]MDW8263964.1 hypothetical protein [Gemmataceae bacterium]
MESVGVFVVLFGGLVAAAAAVRLVTAAFTTHLCWGIALLLCPPLAVAYVPLHWRAARRPALLLLLGAIVAAVPYAARWYHVHYIDLGSLERIVDGERHITLTGWDGTDYSFLQHKPDVVVLEMANPDVDDATLTFLRGMTQLRELDLSGTQITDAGLEVLAELPRLEELRLARTSITDAGFRRYLARKPTLRCLDLSGTEVKSKTKREWKNAQPGRVCLD